MEDNKITITLLPNEFLVRDWKKVELPKNAEELKSFDFEKAIEESRSDGIFDLDRAINFSGKIGGVCYEKEGFERLINEKKDRTDRRIAMTLNNGHLSIYDHIYISFYMRNIPKLLAMVLNNEKQYTTSEKSARYTEVASQSDASVSEREKYLYDKWTEILKVKIKDRYGDVYPDGKIKKLAMENARYMVSVFMPTFFVYTTSLRQINNLAAYMEKYIKEADMMNPYDIKLTDAMKDVLKELKRVNVLEPRLMVNNKNMSLSLFGDHIEDKPESFGERYSTNYKISYAGLAQAQRHRTIDYEMERLDNKEFYVPPIIRDDKDLVDEWNRDIQSVASISPQGELVLVNESGSYKNFIRKIKERLCSAPQLEINDQSKETLHKYRDALVAADHPLKDDIEKYTHGARCTFPDFKCTEDCGFKEGKTLTRKI